MKIWKSVGNSIIWYYSNTCLIICFESSFRNSKFVIAASAFTLTKLMVMASSKFLQYWINFWDCRGVVGNNILFMKLICLWAFDFHATNIQRWSYGNHFFKDTIQSIWKWSLIMLINNLNSKFTILITITSNSEFSKFSSQVLQLRITFRFELWTFWKPSELH